MLLALQASAQSSVVEKTPYYVNINSIAEGTILDIQDYMLHLEYFDSYGTAKEFLFRIYNQERKQMATLRLDKTYGLNHYSVQLDKVASGWELNNVYVGEFKCENGTVYKVPIRIVEAPMKELPSVSILVNPIRMDCKNLEQNLVEFYGNVEGGRPPYKISWFVLNASRTDFLYQPKEDIVRLAGKTSFITVDKNPEYYVVLYVIDACGNEKKQIVNMTCEDNKKKINTIFVEELDSPLFKGKKAIQ
jgi:hypothetical protein